MTLSLGFENGPHVCTRVGGSAGQSFLPNATHSTFEILGVMNST